MAAWVEFVEETDALMSSGPKASAAGRRRMYLSTSGTQMKLVDHLGNITLVSSLLLQAVHNPVIAYANSPYDAVPYETVKALTQLADAGDIVVRLPDATLCVGSPVKILSVTPPYSGVLPGGHQIEVQGTLGQLVNGSASVFLTNAGENLNLESDGSNWLIVG